MITSISGSNTTNSHRAQIYTASCAHKCPEQKRGLYSTHARREHDHFWLSEIFLCMIFSCLLCKMILTFAFSQTIISRGEKSLLSALSAPYSPALCTASSSPSQMWELEERSVLDGTSRISEEDTLLKLSSREQILQKVWDHFGSRSRLVLPASEPQARPSPRTVQITYIWC